MIDVKLNTKKTNIRVLDENDEELGILSFYPSDFELPERVEKGQEQLKEIIMQVKADAQEKSEEEFFRVMHEMNEKAKEILNYIFNSDVAIIFGNTSMFTPTSDGTLLIENIMDGIIPAIVKEIKKNTSKATENMQKYLKDYQGK